jgi:hypothetical protein
MSWNPGRTPGPAADRRRTAPPRLSRSQLEPPPLALGTLSDQEPCRWELRSKFPADQADRAIQLTVGTAALALAAWVAGTVIDPYGFPVSQPQDLLPLTPCRDVRHSHTQPGQHHGNWHLLKPAEHDRSQCPGERNGPSSSASPPRWIALVFSAGLGSLLDWSAPRCLPILVKGRCRH